MSTAAIGPEPEPLLQLRVVTPKTTKNLAPNVRPMASGLDHAVTSTIVSYFKHLVVGL